MRELTKEDLRQIHKQSLMTKEEMHEHGTLGCFHCSYIFKPTEVTKFAEDEALPVCPACFIDSVISLDGLTKQDGRKLLKQMNAQFF